MALITSDGVPFRCPASCPANSTRAWYTQAQLMTWAIDNFTSSQKFTSLINDGWESRRAPFHRCPVDSVLIFHANSSNFESSAHPHPRPKH